MDADLKQKWVDALRSGEYIQGQGWLRLSGPSTDQFCCLGVLLNVIDPQGWECRKESPMRPGGRAFTHARNSGLSGMLDMDLADDLGLGEGTENDDFGTQRADETLINMNDSGKPFTQIADWIEESL